MLVSPRGGITTAGAPDESARPFSWARCVGSCRRRVLLDCSGSNQCQRGYSAPADRPRNRSSPCRGPCHRAALVTGPANSLLAPRLALPQEIPSVARNAGGNCRLVLSHFGVSAANGRSGGQLRSLFGVGPGHSAGADLHDLGSDSLTAMPSASGCCPRRPIAWFQTPGPDIVDCTSLAGARGTRNQLDGDIPSPGNRLEAVADVPGTFRPDCWHDRRRCL